MEWPGEVLNGNGLYERGKWGLRGITWFEGKPIARDMGRLRYGPKIYVVDMPGIN